MRVRGPPTSSGDAKGELKSTTLEGDEKGEEMSDVRFQDEILMQTVRETSTTEDLTLVSIDEQMQIAHSMGIEVGGAEKAEEYADELTKELGLISEGEYADVADEAGNDEATRIASGGFPYFNLDPDIFTDQNPVYQEIASSSNADAEQVLGLVHTHSSILHAKDALKTIPEEDEEVEEYYYAEKEDQLIQCQLMQELMMNGFKCQVDFLLKMQLLRI